MSNLETINTAELAEVLPKEYIKQSLSSLFESGLPKGLYTGLKPLDELVRLDTGRLCVITGIPNDGKSEFVDFLTTSYNRRYGYKTLYFSPENQPVALHVAKLVSKFTCKRFCKSDLSSDEVEAAVNYIADNFFFCNYDKIRTSAQILSLARREIQENGVKLIVIDAFNKIEAESANEDVLIFISRLLDELCRFAIKEDVLVILVAHPRKMETERNGTPRIPNPYDINGSANFFNKSDFVITIHRNRTKPSETGIYAVVGKVKFSNYGKQGRIALNYDVASGNYYPSSSDDLEYEDYDFEGGTPALPAPFEFPSTPKEKEPLDVEVSYYKGATDNEGSIVNLKDFLFTDKYKGIAEHIRSGNTPEERKELKQSSKSQLPCITVGGVFSQRGAKYLETPSGLLAIDIDYADNQEIINRAPTILKGLDYIAYYAKSITGDGYFAICRIAEPERFKNHYLALEKEFKGYGITIDKSCKDISRLRFATYDEDYYYNPQARTYLKVSNEQPPLKGKEEYVSTRSTETNTEKVERLIQQLQDCRRSLPDDYDTWFKVGMSLSSTFGEQGRKYFHTLSSTSPKYDSYQCDEQYDTILEHYGEDNQYTLGTLVYLINNAINQ